MRRDRDGSRKVRAAGGLLLVAIVVAMGAGLGGCGDEAPRFGERARKNVEESGPHKAKWLDLGSEISPAQWLASRKDKELRVEDDGEVKRIDLLLATTHRRYRESERMIANRSAQLEDMLARIGISEDAVDVLADLAEVGRDPLQIEGFGAISQYYFNLRASSMSRADALATLKARYGAGTEASAGAPPATPPPTSK